MRQDVWWMDGRRVIIPAGFTPKPADPPIVRRDIRHSVIIGTEVMVPFKSLIPSGIRLFVRKIV